MWCCRTSAPRLPSEGRMKTAAATEPGPAPLDSCSCTPQYFRASVVPRPWAAVTRLHASCTGLVSSVD